MLQTNTPSYDTTRNQKNKLKFFFGPIINKCPTAELFFFEFNLKVLLNSTTSLTLTKNNHCVMDTSFSYHVTKVYLKLTTKKATCWIIFKLKIINHHLTTHQIKRGVTKWRSSFRRYLTFRVWPPDWCTPPPFYT